MIALAGLPALPRLSLTQWLLVGSGIINAVLLIALYGLQVDLPVIGTLGPDGVIAERDAALADRARLLAERKAAVANGTRIAGANTAATKKADTDEKRYAETDRDDAERFIAANRVRRCPAARGDAPTQGDSSERAAAGSDLPVLDDRLPESLISVPESDILVCTENTRRLILGREWAIAIEANHAAPVTEPVEP